MIDAQVAKLADIQRQNQSRLENQVLEVERKSAEIQKQKEEKKKRELVNMHMSRQQQLRWKEEGKAQQKAEEAHDAMQMKTLNDMLREEEEDERIQAILRAKTQQDYLLKQTTVKQDKMRREKTKEVMEAQQTAQWMRDDDAIFGQYADMCTGEWSQEGKNLKPMQLLLKKKAPL